MAPLQHLERHDVDGRANDVDADSNDGSVGPDANDGETETRSVPSKVRTQVKPLFSATEKSVLRDILEEHDVYLGGASMGKGFRHTVRRYLRNELSKLKHSDTDSVSNGSSNNRLAVDDTVSPASIQVEPTKLDEIIEDPFYVCDLGVVVAQFHQWKRHFPRVEPFYAVKCNPDPVIVRTLATLGANFDCASRKEINIVEQCCENLPRRPDIIYANPCKARTHLRDAVRKGVTKVTFDNAQEILKCASISKNIQLVLRIITDDTGAQCRLSSKYGAPRSQWKDLLLTAKACGMQVVGVSFHVGSGCRDASRYDMALRDAREVFDMGKNEFGFDMSILDIGGGFPGETYSLWNPADSDIIVPRDEDDEKEEREDQQEEEALRPFMFFTDIADHISPVLDELFPVEENVRIIGEPGRYLVAASSTIVVAVTSVRNNLTKGGAAPISVSDKRASKMIYDVSRETENKVIREHGAVEHPMFDAIVEQIADYSQLFAKQQLTQQEVDCLVDATNHGQLDPPAFAFASDEKSQEHTVEGITARIVGDCMTKTARPRSRSFDADKPTLSLASAGEAAVSGVVKQAMVDSGTADDAFAYYVNDGVYGAFNNLMFDHAVVRPRLLRNNPLKPNKVHGKNSPDDDLYPSTIFGPTCDSIDVICRSVLLPKLEIGDWLYFENMGAYTSAAASTFNGFEPTKKFYVCSVLPEML